MSRADFTRWNRAGLDKFRYVDGNAATYLEYMRQLLMEKFRDDAGNLIWSDLAEMAPELNLSVSAGAGASLKARYEAETDDYAWEIVRVLCKSVHILGEYLDAYSNETFIETAGEWENIRKLVSMLDYSPAPPASATTWLTFIAKDDVKGTISAGFQVKNAPADGSTPQVFETLEDLVLNSELNALSPRDRNRSQKYYTCGGMPAETPLVFTPEEGVDPLTPGSVAILFDDEKPYSVSVLSSEEGRNSLSLHQATEKEIMLADVSLLCKPAHLFRPLLNGGNVVATDTASAGVLEEAYIAWESEGKWSTGVVKAKDRERLRIKPLKGAPLPGKGVSLYLLNVSYPQDLTIGGTAVKRIVLPREQDLAVSHIWDEYGGKQTPKPCTEGGLEIYQYLEAGKKKKKPVKKAFYLPGEALSFAAVKEAAESDSLTFPGKPADIGYGDWVIASEGTAYYPLQVTSVAEGAGSFTLTFSEAYTGSVETLICGFEERRHPYGWNRNTDNIVTEGDSSATGSILYPETIPEGMKKGRYLVISDNENSVVARVTAVDSDAGSLTVSPSLAGLSGDNGPITFQKYNTLFYANTISAGHGKKGDVMIAGSGDASQLNQSFTLEPENISFVADASMNSGMRADISVAVAGREYANVQDFSASGPADAHFTVRLTESGQVKITFGDGKNGRRLPTGRNNIKVRCRTGAGAEGNLDAGTLTEMVRSDPLVESVTNRVSCSGGNDCETVTSLKENAASSVLTLGRAVSVSDFEKMAVAHSSVWKAAAFEKQAGFSRNREICVVIVPPEGKTQPSLNSEIQRYLTTAAIPGVNVTVDDFRSLYLKMRVEIRIDTDAYDKDTIEGQVRTALGDAFSLSSGGLGESLYRSRIYSVVESVEGVMNSGCFIDAGYLTSQIDADPVLNKGVMIMKSSDDVVKTVVPAKDQVIYIPDPTSDIDITVTSWLVTEAIL